MYEFWCGVILRDVRSAILTTHQNEYIYFHIQPITFLLHTRYYHKTLYDIYCISFINKISKITSVLNKQKLKFKTKVKQLLPLPFLRLSRNYECVFKGISFMHFRAPAYFHLYYLYFNRGFDIKCST